MRLALTGATGFVGSHVLDRALAAGHEVAALTRRPQPERVGVRWVAGALDRLETLGALAKGADAVVHVAGVINGDAEAFHAGNVLGTEAMLAAARAGDVKRFVHISSLAAREPELSAYGASKAKAEEAVLASGAAWTIIRPPAIYGPRDREMLDLFRFSRFRVIPLPPATRLSLIAVEDLADLILACAAEPATIGRTYEADDGRPGGWTASELARTIGRAVGRRVLPLPIPRAALSLASGADRLLRGKNAKLTLDRVAYFCHPDWTATPHAFPPAGLWSARIESGQGLAETARWYRAQGWL